MNNDTLKELSIVLLDAGNILRKQVNSQKDPVWPFAMFCEALGNACKNRYDERVHRQREIDEDDHYN